MGSLTFTCWDGGVRSPGHGRECRSPWDKLTARVLEPRPAAHGDKLGNPAWAFATFAGAYRRASGLLALHALAVDLDSDPTLPEQAPGRGSPDLDARDLRAALTGWRYLAHTTWSHRTGAARWRVILPYSRPCSPSEHATIAAWVGGTLRRRGLAGVDADPTWAEPSRAYVVPVRLAGGQYVGDVSPPEWGPLDVDAILSAAAAQAGAQRPPLASPGPTREAVAGEGRGARYGHAALAAALALVRGSPRGQRNATLFREAAAIGELVAGGACSLSESVVEEELVAAAGVAGLDRREATATARRGLAAGAASPRGLPPSEERADARHGSSADPGPPPPGAPPTPEEEEPAWKPPVPLADTVCRVPVPVDALPDDLRAVVEGIADSYQVPAALPALLALALLSGACATVRVSPWGGWEVPLPLWACVVLRPGARKSPVLEVLRRPIDELETAQRIAARVLAERERGDEAKRGKGAPRDEEPPPVPTLVTSGDDTPEALVALLAANPDGLTIASAEGVAFQHMTGLYSDKGANVDVYLKAHGGERLTVHRRRDPPLEVPAPLLAVALAVQPFAVGEARQARALSGRGVLQRFLWAVPPDGIGSRDTAPRPLDPELPRKWAAVYARAFAHRGVPLVLSLDPPALARFVEWRATHEASLPSLPDVLLEWEAKVDGYVLRLAGVLHLAEGGGGVIGLCSLNRALAIFAVLSEHARAALIGLEVDPAARLAARLLAWLRRYPELVTFSERDAHAAVKGSDVDVELVRAALRLLDAHGYARPVPTGGEAAPRSRGRPASPLWEANPMWTRAGKLH